MKSMRTPFLPWLLFADVVLAGVFGAMVFVFLNIVSGGILITLVTVAVMFLVFGCIHYIVWGRAVSPAIPAAEIRPFVREQMPQETIAVELTDEERQELIALLDRSLNPALANGKSTDANQDLHRARRRDLLERLRMYGA